VPARRPVDRNAQGGPVRSGPSRPVSGTGGRGRRGRRPEQRRLRPSPGTGAGRVQGVHGRVGTPEHAVLGHRFRSGYRRGPNGRAVRVHAPPPKKTPSPRRRSRRQVAGRPIAAVVRRQIGRQQRLSRPQDRTGRAPVVGRVNRVSVRFFRVLNSLNFFFFFNKFSRVSCRRLMAYCNVRYA